MDLDKYIETLEKELILNQKDLKLLCDRLREIIAEESNVQLMHSPAIICGDIHGQFYDLLNIFKLAGKIQDTNQNFVFIGDFVDRGYNSVETLEYLLCLKVKFPNRILLLRGNHECRQITQAYGFYEECARKYGNSKPWEMFTEIFDFLPIGGLIDGNIFCVHGGLSPPMNTIEQIRTLDRKQEIPLEGAITDLLWSDPDNIELFQYNQRGAGYIFGSKVTQVFNHLNGIDLICRAHQLVNDGYQYWFDKLLVTVWSAPNYCYRMKNKASYLVINEQGDKEFKIFEEVQNQQKGLPPQKVLPYFL